MFRATLRLWIRGIFARSSFENEISDELQFHIQERADDLVQKSGLPREEAVRKARIEFGSIEKYKDEVREAIGRQSVDNLRRDLSYALRMLRKNPVFTLTAVLTLSLGIGANSAIFSAVNALLFHPIGVSEPDRLVAVRMSVEKLNFRNVVISPRDLAGVRDSRAIFADAALSHAQPYIFRGTDLPEQLSTIEISWQWFDVLGAKPILGRSFRPEEDQPNANHVVILANATWKRLFGSDPSIVGKTIELNQAPYRVIGVMGADQNVGVGWSGEMDRQDLFVPIGLPSKAYAAENRFNQSYLGLARLQPNVRFEQAQAYMSILTERGLQDPNGDDARKAGWHLYLIPYMEFTAGSRKMPMLVLLGAIGFVLLIACSNIAALIMTRMSSRSREFAVRKALGARDWQIVRQAFVEAFVLAAGGSVLGIAVAYGLIQAAMFFAPEDVLAGLRIRIDASVLLFTLLVGTSASILFGILPVWHVARGELIGALKDGGRAGTASQSRLRLRSMLVTAEIGLALVLLVGAGLFLRSLFELARADLGFRPEGVMTGILNLPNPQYVETEKRVAFYRAALARLANLPGVKSAAVAMPLPFIGASSGSFQIVGRQMPPGEPIPHADVRLASPGIFSSLRIPLKSGRVFTDYDTLKAEDVVVIDDYLARQYWPNEDPLGQRIQHDDGKGASKIIGVVGHVKSFIVPGGSDRGVIYHSMHQRPGSYAVLVIRSNSDPRGLALAMKEVVRSIDPALPVSDLKTMDERIAAALTIRRFAVLLLSVFAIIALFMAALGLYGVVNYGVVQRTQEIGIRMALGASRAEVIRLIIRQGLRMTVSGIGFGLISAVFLGRLVSSQLFNVSPVDPPTLIGMALALLCVALFAAYVPARRAARIDPFEACRSE